MSVVGGGGNGSIFLTHLCRIHQAWTRLGGAPFKITVHDPDRVSPANLARQVFCEADIGQPKAEVLALRMRAFYGIPVEHHVGRFHANPAYGTVDDLIVGCVDNLDARRTIADLTKARTVHRRQWGETRKSKFAGAYWLDLGNENNTGQVILGGHGLPNFFDVFPKAKRAKDPADVPSCSMAEALEKQDLFINSIVATHAGQLLWTMMRHGQLSHHGYFINLKTGRTAPIEVPAPPPPRPEQLLVNNLAK